MTGAELLEVAFGLARRARLLLDAEGLSIRQYHALRALDQRPQRVGELAQIVEIMVPSAFGLVDSLVGRGFAERRPDADDGRVSVVELTATGRRALGRAERHLVEVFDELAAESRLDALDRSRA
jgi:DNA-binding MarR family transcriptional regulator